MSWNLGILMHSRHWGVTQEEAPPFPCQLSAFLAMIAPAVGGEVCGSEGLQRTFPAPNYAQFLGPGPLCTPSRTQLPFLHVRSWLRKPSRLPAPTPGALALPVHLGLLPLLGRMRSSEL